MQSQEEGSKVKFECVINYFSSGVSQRCDGVRPVCGKCQSSRRRSECVYEDVGLVSFGGLGVPVEEVTLVPPSPTVLEFLNHSASMELSATDFEDPFTFDATTLSKDDLHLRLYVSLLLSPVTILISVIQNLPFAHVTPHSAVSFLSLTVTSLGCLDLSPSNRP